MPISIHTKQCSKAGRIDSLSDAEIEEIKANIGFDLSNKRTRHEARQELSRLQVSIARRMNKWDYNIKDKYAENWRPEKKWRQKYGF